METDVHYFIFYGFFHPRDWCSIWPPLGWFCDFPAQHEHENDFEGALVTVDKRFTSQDWPHGQIVNIETINHTSVYPAYRNCTFNEYTILPSLQFKPRYQLFDGCIEWVVDEMRFTEYQPPARTALAIQARGHGVSMRDPGWSGFPGGDGVIYYPADWGAEVPPDIWGPSVRYELRRLDAPELWFDLQSSLWSKRLTSGGLPTSTYDSLHKRLVGRRHTPRASRRLA